MINFAEALKSKNNKKPIDPTEIYETLDRKSTIGPLRPVQQTILDEWFKSRRDDAELIIKLHTGEGKTLIGLLILQSVINELEEKKCLYICPDRYLAEQVAQDAERFGISYYLLQNESELPQDFNDGKKLLITHVQKVFNGKTIFGLNENSLDIDTIILDDSHACIDSIKKTCTIEIPRNDKLIDIPRNNELYDKILSTFESDLREQGEGDFLDIQQNINNDVIMLIPYWAWIDNKSIILKYIKEHENEIPSISFTLPLIKNHLEHCSAYITSKSIEIVPEHIPIDNFKFFTKARRKILMSATTQNDSFFIKGLGFSPDSIKNTLTNSKNKWSGEKMVIIPSLIHDDLDRDLIKTTFAKPLKKNSFGGIVSLVPSFKQSEIYEKLGSVVVVNKDIRVNISKLKDKDFSRTIVFVNRYDGIDLPDEMCRILIFDSLPYFNNLQDRYEIRCREDSNINQIKYAQKIEQGMGRSVRGEKDYSVILLIGSELVKFVKSKKTSHYFSEQTKKQIEIGEEIASIAKKDIDSETKPITVISSLINQCLKRDGDWKAFYQERMNQIDTKVEKHTNIIDILNAEYNAEKAFYNGNYELATNIIDSIIKTQKDNPSEQSWYLQILAKYTYSNSKINADKIQKKAFLMNSNLLKPKDGITYKKIGQIDLQRITNTKRWISKFEDQDEINLTMKKLLDDLSFGTDHNSFEKALEELGLILGFESHRPDKMIKKGSDVLWGTGSNNDFFMFECKNEVSESRITITKTEAGQMNNHCGWFDQEYGNGTRVKRIMIIPTNILAKDANFTHEIFIMEKDQLEKLKKSIKSFFKEILPYKPNTVTENLIKSSFEKHNLSLDKLNREYSIAVKTS